MAELTITVVALTALALKGATILVLSYAGARLAIRHERRTAALIQNFKLNHYQ